MEGKSFSLNEYSSESGVVIWLTGISGSGKTTLGNIIVKQLRTQKNQVEFLDGDIVRDFFENDLGYTRNERILNIKRIAFAAHMMAKHGVCVVVACIAPYYEARDFIRKKLKNYIQIFLDTKMETVIARDVKGHYKKVKTGQMENFIGCDDGYDIPRNPDLRVDTSDEEIDQSLRKIMELLAKKGVYRK